MNEFEQHLLTNPSELSMMNNLLKQDRIMTHGSV
jgi:hypothetical protein